MKTFPPPVRIIVPGRVYRRDNLDLTHTPMFQQFEGLVVGEGVTLADLKGTLRGDAAPASSATSKVRLRPSFFPYTEPSAEVDISCQGCGGSGCGICKQTGWLEILGSGMVHPAVFEAVGYDPEQGHRLRVRHRHGARRDAEVRRRRHPPVLRERPALPRAVPRYEGPPLLAARVRRRARHAAGHRRADVGARLRRRRHRAARATTRCSTSRSPPTGPTACRWSAWRARWRRRTACRCASRPTAAGTRRHARSPAPTRAASSGSERRRHPREPDLVPALRRRRRRRDGRRRRRTGCRRGSQPPASARSATSSTSPTTCCSSSGSRCTRSISRRSAAREIRVRTARGRRDASRRSTARRATLTPDMLVIADARGADRRRRRDGRRRLRGDGRPRARSCSRAPTSTRCRCGAPARSSA